MRIVMLDASKTYLQSIRRLLAGVEVEVASTTCWSKLAGLIRQESPHVLVLDVDLNEGGVNGILIGRTVRRFYDVPILFLSDQPEEQLRAAIASIPGAEYLRKSADVPTALPNTLRALALVAA